jgi:hypothetical protein
MINDYLKDEATIYHRTGRDGYGAPTFNAGTIVATRYELINKLRYQETPPSDKLMADVKAFFETDVTIENDDRVVIAGVNYKVVDVSLKRFIDEVSHKEALLKYE